MQELLVNLQTKSRLFGEVDYCETYNVFLTNETN